ncbi:MAG: endonuclease [Paludibacteraceae bacterium]|nr:endonuclease [Paludibacteraceae bacterium]
MYRFIYIIFLFIIFSLPIRAENTALRVVSYNVENLFDTKHDTLKNDSSFLPDGMHYWSYRRYQTKIDRIAQVIVNVAGWESIPLVGLCEVENARCLRNLCYALRRFHYKYVHYDSPDERGIDVALLFDSTQITILHSQAIPIMLDNDPTRDILYVSALYLHKDTIHTMVCHLPSQLGGATSTDWKRQRAKQIIQTTIDSILFHQPSAKIVVMGDMNTHPQDDLHGMTNLMLSIQKAGYGTHKYQGIWTCLDQFYVSPSIVSRSVASIFSPQWLLEEDTKYLDYKPRRTYIGYRYNDGYSDHLPIVLHIQLDNKE